MKRLMLIIMALIIAVAVMGCEKTDKMAYKSIGIKPSFGGLVRTA